MRWLPRKLIKLRVKAVRLGEDCDDDDSDDDDFDGDDEGMEVIYAR